MRKVAVIGVGMVPFGRHPNETVADLGAMSVASALANGALGWKDAQSLFCGVVGGSARASPATSASRASPL